MTDFETFLIDNSDRIYRFWVYKRMFTPYEQEQKFSDESQYESDYCSYGIIREAIELPGGRILLGIEPVFFELPDGTTSHIEYYFLDEIRLEYHSEDINKFVEDE